VTAPYNGPKSFDDTAATPYMAVAKELTPDPAYTTGLAWSLGLTQGEENKATLIRHLRAVKAQKQAKGSRLCKSALHLRRLSIFLHGLPYEQAPVAAVEAFCGERHIEYELPRRMVTGKAYVAKRVCDLKDDTLNRVRYLVKQFYIDIEGPEAAKHRFANIQIGAVAPPDLTEADLVDADTFHKIMQATTHPCDRALLAIMAETGMRIGAIASLNVGDVIEQDDDTLILNVDPKAPKLKTPQAPKRIFWAVPHVLEWLGACGEAKADDPLIPNVRRRKGERIRSEVVNGILLTLCRRAGVRRVHCHMFRRAVATEMASCGMPRSKMNALFGWSSKTTTADRYVALSKADVTAAMRRYWKLPTNDVARRSLMGHIKCPGCGHVISVTDSFCPRCRFEIKPGDRTSTAQLAAEQAAMLYKAMERLIPQLERLHQQARRPEVTDEAAKQAPKEGGDA
jgi:integrase